MWTCRARKTLPILLFLAALLVIYPGQAMRAAPSGPTILTIFGAVGDSNRPPFNSFTDSFFAYHEFSFEKAFVLDRESLLALPQVSLVANATNWERAISASGPRLADVLAAAGVGADAKVTLIALDGYAVELDAAERQHKDWVLALSADSSALGIGDRGPLWLLYDTGGEAIRDDGESKWVYSVFAIKAD